MFLTDYLQPVSVKKDVSPVDDSVLRLHDIRFGYGKKKNQLKTISLDVKKGEFFCLLGPSGCGKTTLLKIVAGLLNPDSGKIEFNTACQKPKTGMVFQDLALFPHMTALQNIEYGLKGIKKRAKRQKALHYMDRVGLQDYANAYPHTLSGGQKQRLALARALAPEPDLILLDEPFASQDMYLREKLRDDVLHIIKETGVAALMVTHDPDEAMFLSDRMAVMKDGEIIQSGTPVSLYMNPVNDYVAGFFGSVNHCFGKVDNNMVHTCLGSVPADGMQNGKSVKVVFRPESLILDDHIPDPACPEKEKEHAHGKINEIKILRHSTLVHLNLCDPEGKQQGYHVHARIPGKFVANGNGLQDIRLDTSKVFIFEDTLL